MMRGLNMHCQRRGLRLGVGRGRPDGGASGAALRETETALGAAMPRTNTLDVHGANLLLIGRGHATARPTLRGASDPAGRCAGRGCRNRGRPLEEAGDQLAAQARGMIDAVRGLGLLANYGRGRGHQEARPRKT